MLTVHLPQAAGRRTGHANTQPLSAAGPQLLARRQCAPGGRRQRQAPLRAAPASPSQEGDEGMQDKLVGMLQVQIGQQHVRNYFQDESDKLRNTAEEAKEEVDRLNKLELDRSTLAFGSALADINQSADEFEAQLLAQRKEMEADAAALVTWQKQMAVDRSRGHFFKSLYQADVDEDGSRDGRQSRRQALTESQPVPASPGAGNALQLIACSFLAGVLIMAVAADLASPSPAYPVDCLYTVLGLGLGASAWGQRRAL